MENQSLDLSRLWDVLRRWWWLLLACMIVAAVSSFLGTTQMPRIYQATSTVIVGQTLELGLSDWCQLPRYGEAVAYEFTQRRGATGAVERITCRIYLQKVPVDASRKLVGVDLPDRETMHVFAITLEGP